MAFYFKKIIIPIESLATTVICVFRLFKEVKKKTQRLCFSTGKDTETWSAFKKENFPWKKQQRVILSLERPSPARAVPGHSHQKATRWWRVHVIISENMIPNWNCKHIHAFPWIIWKYIFLKRISTFNSLDSEIWASDWQSNQGMRWSQQTSWPK